MEGGRVEDHVIRSAVRLVHPMVLRNVFSMAVDEMDKIYDLDFKVCCNKFTYLPIWNIIKFFYV